LSLREQGNQMVSAGLWKPTFQHRQAYANRPLLINQRSAFYSENVILIALIALIQPHHSGEPNMHSRSRVVLSLSGFTLY